MRTRSFVLCILPVCFFWARAVCTADADTLFAKKFDNLTEQVKEYRDEVIEADKKEVTEFVRNDVWVDHLEASRTEQD